MKAINRLFLIPSSLFIVAAMLSSCNDLKNDKYYDETNVENINAAIRTVNETTQDYLASRSDLSSMTNLLKEQGVFNSLDQKGQLSTLLVVTNDDFKSPVADSAKYIAYSHVTDIAVSPSKLNSGDRLLMWHNKYVTITLDEAALKGDIIGHAKFNNALLSEVIHTTDGYIYVISDMIATPTSLQDYINSLSDDYSIFKDMILSSGGKVFDAKNSKVVGVDANGNTVYDSVFIYTNTFFDAKNFNLSSEALKATMLVFSNDVINTAMADADAKLRAWGYRKGEAGSPDYIEGRADSILRKWILEVAFYNRTYTAADLTPNPLAEEPSDNDIKSIYDRQWRTSVQSLDLDNPVELSNGMAYLVKSFRFPTNVLIYRLKDEFYIYQYCDADQKEMWFKWDNLKFNKTNEDVAAWTPAPGVWPMHANTVLVLNPVDAAANRFRFDFTPIHADAIAGGYDVSPRLVPPGTYRLAMGFKQNLGIKIDVSVWAVVASDTVQMGETETIDTGTGSTAYHYDRGQELSNRYPEGYDPKGTYIQGSSASKSGNYDTDGGPVMNEVTIEDINGDGSAVQILIRMDCSNLNSITSFTFNHWCLRPTANNY